MSHRKINKYNLVAGIGFIILGIYFIVLKDKMAVGLFEIAIGVAMLAQVAYYLKKR